MALATARPRAAGDAARPDAGHSCDFAARHADPVEQQFQMKLRVGLLAAALLVGPERVPFLVRKHALARPAPGGPPCRRASARRGEARPATAGAAVVMPAATVKPVGRSLAQRSAMRAKQPVAAVGQVDRAKLGERARPMVDDRPQPIERHLPVRGEIGRVRGRSASARGSTSSTSSASSVRRKVLREPKRLGAAAVLAPNDVGQRQQPVERIDRRRNRLAIVDRVERAADPLVELGIADRDQPRQQQAAAAGANEGLGDGAHGAVVGQQDPALGQAQRVAAEALDQPAASASANERWVGMV